MKPLCSSYCLWKIWLGFNSPLAKSIFSHLNSPAGKWDLLSSSYTLTAPSVRITNASFLYTASRQHGGTLLHMTEGSGNLLKSRVSVSNNADHIFKAKYHNNHSKDVNTFAESTRTKYYVFGFLQADEGKG